MFYVIFMRDSVQSGIWYDFSATVQLGTSPPSPSPITAPFYPTTKYLI